MDSYDIDSDGRRIYTPEERRQQARRYLIGGVVGLLSVLALRLAVLALLPPAGPAPAPTLAVITATAEPFAALPTLPPEPTTPPLPTRAIGPALTPAADCPPAATVPAGARVGWLARAEGCADVLYASVNGTQQWVIRPTDVPDQLVQQLPALPIR